MTTTTTDCCSYCIDGRPEDCDGKPRPSVIEPGSNEYTHSRIFVETFEGAVYAYTTAQLAKEHEIASRCDIDRPTHFLYVDAEGNLHPAIIKTDTRPYDENDYATVRAFIRDAVTGTVIARFSYSVDGRA